MSARHPLPHRLAVGCAVAVLSLAGCGQVESARDALAGNDDAPRVESRPPLPLGELDDAVHELESVLGLLMADRYGADGRPLAFPETPPSVLAPPAPFDIAALLPSPPPPEPIFDGLPPEDTVPADTPGALLRLWSEGGPDDAVAMADSAHREVALLRRDIQRLNHNLESLLHHYVGSLHEENERLRQEIQRLYIMRMQEGRFDSAVPRPNAGVLDHLRDDALMSAVPPMDMPGPATGRVTVEPVPLGDAGGGPVAGMRPPALDDGPGVMAMAALGGTQYAIVEEWGRTPEEARSFGEGVTSLKGLILAVPPGLDHESLEELAYHMREEYGAFDNINVKIFEGVEAAQEYASTNVVTPGLLVADITKHAATQRDIILLLQGDEMKVLPGPTGGATTRAEAARLLEAAGVAVPEAPPAAAPEDAPVEESIQEDAPREEFSLEALLERTRSVDELAAELGTDAFADAMPLEPVEETPDPLAGAVPILVPADQYDAGRGP